MKDFRDFKVWGKAHELVLATYRATETFPKHEVFGLVSQIRRCSSSIPANIAEGCGRMGNSELHRFLQISCGSANELEYHLLLAKDLGYLDEKSYLILDKQLAEMKRMLVALTRKVGSERKSWLFASC
jgi:four helix bundle protein